jgi:hypothetical protein
LQEASDLQKLLAELTGCGKVGNDTPPRGASQERANGSAEAIDASADSDSDDDDDNDDDDDDEDPEPCALTP